MLLNDKNIKGRIIIPAGINVWPHELETARALANSGYIIKFIKKTEGFKIHSADIIMNGKMWELKSPNGSKLSTIERNLRRAKTQSKYIVFDSIRIKKIPDSAIKREIQSKAPLITDINEIILINRRRECIDIYKKVR